MVKWQPSPDLADVVEFYWALTLNGEGPLILPDTTTNVVFNLGTSHELVNARTKGLNGTIIACHLVGPKGSGVRVQSKGRVNVLGVRFRLGGFSSFSNMPLSSVFEQTALAKDIFKHEFEHRKLEASGKLPFYFKVELIEKWLRRNRIGKGGKPAAISEVRLLAEAICKQNGGVAIQQMTKDSKMSTRWIRDRFKEAVGLSPKHFARIVRLNKVAKGISDERSLTRLGLEASYYDQSHFIREFKEFTGLTPKEYTGSGSLLFD